MKFIIIAFFGMLVGNLYASEGKSPCGLEGSVEERILDCEGKYGFYYENDNFVLVTRTKKLAEIYKDVNAGLLWSDRIKNPMLYKDAQTECLKKLSEFGGISNLVWRLPTKQEFESANEYGLRDVLPNSNDFFWTLADGKVFKFKSVFNGYRNEHPKSNSGVVTTYLNGSDELRFRFRCVVKI